jgi:hypothetical protein
MRTWMLILEKASFEHEDDAFRAVPHILVLIRAMLNEAPGARPAAREVRDALLEIMTVYTSIPDVHCGAHSHDNGLATSSNSGSDRRSSVASLRTMSTISSGSDADTIRCSASSMTRVSSLAASYSDRTTLSGISEDDDASIRTTKPHTMSHMGASYDMVQHDAVPLSPPLSPTSTTWPHSPLSASAPCSPGRPPSTKTKPWNKAFFRMP